MTTADEYLASERLSQSFLQQLERELDIAGRGGTSVYPKLRPNASFVQLGLVSTAGVQSFDSYVGLFGIYLDPAKSPYDKLPSGYWMDNARRMLILGTEYSGTDFIRVWRESGFQMQYRTLSVRGQPVARYKVADSDISIVGSGAGVAVGGAAIVPVSVASVFTAPEGLPVETSQSQYGSFAGASIRSLLGLDIRNNKSTIFGTNYQYVMVDDLADDGNTYLIRQCGTVQVGVGMPRVTIKPGSGVVAFAGVNGWVGAGVGQASSMQLQIPITLVLGVDQGVSWASSVGTASDELSKRTRQLVSWIQGRQREYTRWGGTYNALSLKVREEQSGIIKFSNRNDMIQTSLLVEVWMPYVTQV